MDGEQPRFDTQLNKIKKIIIISILFGVILAINSAFYLPFIPAFLNSIPSTIIGIFIAAIVAGIWIKDSGFRKTIFGILTFLLTGFIVFFLSFAIGFAGVF